MRRSRLHEFLPVFVLLVGLMLATAAGAQHAGKGVVDEIRYDAASRELLVFGWAAPEQPNVFTSNIIVRVGGHEVYRGRLLRHERPDVVSSTGRTDWLWSGWQVRTSIGHGLPAGRHAVTARVRLTDGAEFDLPVVASMAHIVVEASPWPPKRVIVLVALAALLPVATLIAPMLRAGREAQARRQPLRPSVLFGASVALAFVLLVAAGVSGSSLRFGLSASAVTRDDSQHWFGTPRPIRSDEWLVFTPMAIGQATHDPPFPVINRNIGSDGQNMLIVGMTSVPVAHFSALARPATWGFFLFDLRRALAWYWWLPFFACFAGLWLLLMRLFHLEWRAAAVLSLTVSASPYAIGWSGWPAYAAAFPLLGIVAADLALRTQRLSVAVLCGAGLGLSMAGFALVLYPAWQIAISYLLVPAALAVFLRDRNQLVFGRAQIAGTLTAVAVAASLLIAWWLDARDAISAIAATVYPGQRSTTVGGDVDPWLLAKGLLNPLTMYRETALLNQSDAASFVYLLPALLIGAVVAFWSQRRIDAVAAAVLAFAALALAFQFVGFSAAFARLSLWGLSVPFRVDIALGLAQTLLIAWLIVNRRDGQYSGSRGAIFAAAIGAVATAALATLSFSYLPPELLALASPAFAILSCLALGVAAWWLLSQRFTAFLALYAAWTIGSGLAFNPLIQAPKAIEPIAPIASLLRELGQASGDRSRVAVIGTQDPAMMLLAAGVPIVNGVFYYPQPSLWQRLDPSGMQRALYNRHHRLFLVLAPLPNGSEFRIDSPRLDEVRITVDPARFDFRDLGADLVLASLADADKLSANRSLKQYGKLGAWVVHRLSD